MFHFLARKVGQMENLTVKANAASQIAGVIISGGRSRRWGGGDKFMAELAGKTLLRHVTDRVRDQVRVLILNTNSATERYQDLNLPVVPDVVPVDRGPLAGVLTGLDWTRENLPGIPWVLTVPSDAPFLPTDLAGRLLAGCQDGAADMACAASGGRTHPVIGLWPVALCDQLRKSLMIDDVRKIDAWTSGFRVARVDWPVEPVDPFFNVNTRDDLTKAAEIIR